MVALQFSPPASAVMPQATTSDYWYHMPAGPAPEGITSNLIDPPSIAYKMTICNSVSAVIIISCVTLRFISRYFIIKTVGSDDYVSLLALVFWISTMSIFQYLTSVGLGKHLWDVRTTEYSPSFLLGWTVSAIMYSICMMLIKLSILLLYRRVFPVGNFMVRWWSVLFFTVGYAIAGVCCSFFACSPIESGWDLWVPTKYCINTAAFYIANGILNCVSDLLIFALPIPVIWSLALARRQKIHLCMMFGLGTVSCAVSILRLKSIILFMRHGFSDVTYDIVSINIWSQVEFTVGFICACSPALRPFLIWLFGSFFKEHGSNSDPSRNPYHKATPLNRLRSRASILNIEMGMPGRTRTLVSANGQDWDSESTHYIARRLTSPERIGQIQEKDEGLDGIVVETSYRVQSGVPSPGLPKGLL